MENITCDLLTMEHSGFRPDLLKLRLKSCGLTYSDASTLASEIKKWYYCSGENIAWLVDHLKKIKQAFIVRLAGEGEIPSWLRLRRDLPANGFSLLAKYGSKVVMRVVNLHKAFTYPREVVKPSQAAKFLDAVYREPPSEVSLSSARLFIRRGISSQFRCLSNLGGYPRLAEAAEIIENGTYYSYQEKRNKLWELSEVIQDAWVMVRETGIASQFPAINEILFPLDVSGQRSSRSKREEYRRNRTSSRRDLLSMVDNNRDTREIDVRPMDQMIPSNRIVGAIAGIQEPGLKLRTVASCHIIYQALLEPLKRGMLKLLGELHEDCTFDQSKCFGKVREALAKGRRVFSFDLSNATDRFPAELQFDWLEETAVDDVTYSILKQCASGSFKVNKTLESSNLFPSHLKWTVGQPQGMGPSFMLFALSHHLLVRGICKTLCEPFDYALLGDDIVIWNEKVAEVYYRTMDSLGCKISLDKSICSVRAAEFASVVLTSDGAFDSTKHKKLNRNSLQAYSAIFGPNIGQEINSPVTMSNDVIDVIAEIPEEAGGLGWGRGKALDERLTPSNQRVWDVFNKMNATDPPPVRVPASERGRAILLRSGVQLPDRWVDPSYGFNTVMNGGVAQDKFDRLTKLADRTPVITIPLSESQLATQLDFVERSKEFNDGVREIGKERSYSRTALGAYCLLSNRAEVLLGNWDEKTVVCISESHETKARQGSQRLSPRTSTSAQSETSKSILERVALWLGIPLRKGKG